MSIECHRALYGHLDPFAVAPFVDRYLGEPLTAEDYRLARLLHRAIHGRLPVTADIRFELVQFLSAGLDGRRYDMALHQQKLRVLLGQYDRRISRRRIKLLAGDLLAGGSNGN